MTNRVITWAEKVGSFFKKLFKEVPKVEHVALSVLNYAAPAITVILGLVDPPAAALITPILNTVKMDMATVGAVFQDGTPVAGSKPAQIVESALNSIKTNLAGILELAEVKNSAKVTQIEMEVNGLIAEFDALLEQFSNPLPQG
jgi:hypothetical protein